MKKIFFGLILIISIQDVFGQGVVDTLDQFVINNKQIINNQIEHIRKIYYNFNENKNTYKKKILVNPLNNREINLLIDPKKLEYLSSEASSDWITIYKYKNDTVCSSLDYFEYYYFDEKDNIIKITCDQGDYPDGYNYSFTDYYFENNKLVFVFYKETFNPPIGDDSKPIIIEERHYYFDNRPIKCLAKSNKETNKEIEKIENTTISLKEGFPYLKNAEVLIDKLRTTRIIKE